MYYHAGDVIGYEDINIGLPGTFQTNGRAINCTLWLPRKIANDVSKITIEPIQILSLMTISGRAIAELTDFSDYTFDTQIIGDNVIRITVTKSSSYGVTNYTPLFLQILMRVVFS